MHGRFLSVMFLLSLALGMAFSPAAGQSRGPLLEITPAPVDFDTVFCGSTRSLDVVFRNGGDTALTVQSFDALVAPFSGSLQTPFTLQPGERRSATWCYTPTRVLTRDSISVGFISDNRISYSFGLLTDGSDAMRVAFPGAASAIEAAHNALTAFVSTIMASGSPVHEGAVFAYSSTSQFRLLRGLSEDPALVEAAIPGTATGPLACVYQGIDRSIALLQSAKYRRILIVINASEDGGLANCGPYSAPGVTSAALAADMVIYSISINGAMAAQLSDIATQTGGLHHNATSAAELDQAVQDIMLDLQRSVTQHLVVRGEVVSPSLAFSPSSVLFPTTLAGDTARKTVWIHNVGTSPMEIGLINVMPIGRFSFTFTPKQLLPGDSLPAIASFFPITQAYQSVEITAEINGCDPSVPILSLRGMSYLPVNPSPGPVFSQRNAEIDFGEIPCLETRELAVPLRNVGDQVMHAFYAIIQSANLMPPTQPEWQVGAGSESDMRMMLQGGRQPGPESAQVSVSVGTRLSTSTMFVVDASSALRMPWTGIEGTDALRLVIGRLLASMSSTPELNDRMGVLSASIDGVQSLQPMTTDRAALAALVPAAGNSDTTALLAGISSALDTLERADGLRRLVILTAGSTDLSALTGTPSVLPLVQRAHALGVRVWLLRLDLRSLSDSLRDFVQRLGGTATPSTDAAILMQNLDAMEVASIDTILATWALRWTNVSAKIGVTPAVMRLEQSHVGAANCADFTVSNTGAIPLEIWNVDSETEGVSCATDLPLVVPAGGSAPLRLCYQPPALGEWSVDVEIHNSDCANAYTTVRMTGEATDSNSVILSGDYIVRPGGMISLPLHLDHALSSVYDVRQLTFRIAYDPSLLYPDLEHPVLKPDGSAFGFVTTVTQDYDASSGLARSAYAISAVSGGLPLVSSGVDHALFTLHLRAFLGRTLKTDVTLQSAAFPGSPVALGYGGSASVRIDSMCWLEQRLINAEALWGALGKNAPNPSAGQTTIPYTLREDMSVRLALYDMHGRLLRVLRDGPENAGTHSVVIETHGLPSGAYVCRLESATGILSRILLVRNQKEN
ncbi:MAG: T9SS type A sorting domain-containing protein [Bacteroidetes bacterium]|nr:T9SS type A sorting domain-containing protein [Bacteroidota bacterium]